MALKSTTWAQVIAGLTPKQRAQADAQARGYGKAPVPAATTSRRHPQSIEGGIYRSNSERCAAALLNEMVKRGEIIAWQYEKWSYSMPRLSGARDRSYKPDFVLWRTDGMTVVEIKSAITREQRVSWYKAGYEKFLGFVEANRALIDAGVLRAELWEYDHRTGCFSVRGTDKTADDWLHNQKPLDKNNMTD